MSETTTTTKDKDPISQEVLDLAVKLKEKMKPDTKGIYRLDSKDFMDNLPEGLNEKTVRDFHNYRTDYVAAASLAIGEIGVDVMKNDSSVDVVTMKARIGTDTFRAELNRKTERANHLDNGNVVVRHGNLVPSYKVSGARSSSILMSNVRDHITTLAMQSFDVK